MSNEMLDKLGDFYNSEYVRQHMSWIRKLTFYEWLIKELKYSPINFSVDSEVHLNEYSFRQ